MILPNKFLQKFSKQKYLEKLLPYVKEKKTQAFFTLALTLVAISVFGLFAINPTLVTIIQLRKQLSDAQFADKQLQQKNSNLSTLQGKYIQLQNDLPLIFSALPLDPESSPLLGQIYALGIKNHLIITRMHTDSIPLAGIASNDLPFFQTNITAKGNLSDVLGFLSSLTNFQRVITFTSIEITTSTTDSTELNLVAKAYSKN